MELHSIILFACFISVSAAATTRQIDPPTITISGSVFCNKCFQGSLTTELTTPLPAAEVKLQCAADHTTAVTNESGIFKFTINSDYYASNEECQVKIVKSRDMNCKIPTNVGDGLTGASASESSASGVLNELLYSVGPFAFRPEKLSCPRSADQKLPSSRSAKPSSLSAAASSSTSLFASNLPPLPPAIFPFPHPGFGHAPPITSSPLLPFNPPPYFDNQPTPDQSRPPPPNAEPPETVIPPNKPPSSHPPMHFPPPAMNRAPPNSPPIPRKPSPPPTAYPAPAPKHSKKRPRGKSPSPPHLASPAPRPAPPLPRHGRSPPSRSCPPYEDKP